jgi:hypothetical protein
MGILVQMDHLFHHIYLSNDLRGRDDVLLCDDDF